MNRKEQLFVTKLKNHLLATKSTYSMAIEVKVTKGNTFYLNNIRKSQWATLLKLHEGIPIAHKISDGKINSKLVDVLYLNPRSVSIKPFIAIKFGNGHSYLLPFHILKGFKDNGYKSFSEIDLKSDTYRVKIN